MKLTILKMLLVSIPLMLSCAEIRKATYPPNFTYIKTSDVKNTMNVFAKNIVTIDSILLTSQKVTSAEKSQILSSMSALLAAINKLDQGKEHTNHRLIDNHLNEFRDSIIQAQAMITKNPSNYYLAGQLSGKCTACHQLRKN